MLSRNETKPLVSNFKVLGHQMTSEVRSMTQNHRTPFLPIKQLIIKLEPRSKDRRRSLSVCRTRFDTLRASTDLFPWSKVKGHLRSSEVSDLVWPLTDRDLIWIHICTKWMSNSKSAHKTTLESLKSKKGHPRSPEVIDLI